MSKRRLKVIYIAGWGRSGSTLLDQLLGCLPGALSIGELRSLWDVPWTKQRCSCGEVVLQCPQWALVLNSTARIWATGTVAKLAEIGRELRDGATRTRNVALPWRGSEGGISTRYRLLIKTIYKNIAQVSGASWLIDSSKHPGEAFLLHQTDEIDFELIHLVRDPRAVAYSWKYRPGSSRSAGPDAIGEPPRETLFHTALWWRIWNHLLNRYRRRESMRSRLIRYEDLTANVKDELEKIARSMGLSVSENVFGPTTEVLLRDHHTVAGNPGRFDRGDLRVSVDNEWARKLPVVQKYFITVLTYPLLRRFGYRFFVKNG